MLVESASAGVVLCWFRDFCNAKKNSWCELRERRKQVFVVAVSADWLPALVGWKELGSSPNLWFSEPLSCIWAPQSKVYS